MTCGRLFFNSLLAATLPGLVAAEPPAAADRADLPVDRVVLFTSGVGLFRHAGTVEGNRTVEMRFKPEAVNDLLKSLVLEDLDGGTVSAVSYASREPVTRTLSTFAVDLTDEPSLGVLLSRLRGEKVELDAAAPAAGTIVGVETRTVVVDDTTSEREFLTILAADGLRTLPLDGVTRIRLVDAGLQAELEKALAVLALAHDNEKKSVQLAFRGEGRRRVRLAYVHEAPVWKTSYRLVLGEEGSATLQGWAIVENTTDQDWHDVAVELVSGRPMSFVMDLYEPLFLPRPTVLPELYASLVPQLHGQGLASGEQAERQLRREKEGLRDELAVEDRASRKAGAGGIGGGFGRMAAPRAAASPTAPMEQAAMTANFDMTAVRSMAEGENLGTLFRYLVSEPVSLSRQRSSLLPIVTEKVTARRVSIYDERVLAKHPLAGLRLVNSTPLDLMQGPITVYDRDSYAGDARIEDLPAGGERLVTYAIDLDVEVAPRAEPRPERIVSLKLVRGTLAVSRRLERSKRFDVRNGGREPVQLLIEHPIEPGWTLVEPKAAETTRDRHRFALEVAGGASGKVTVVEEMVTEQGFAVVGLDDAAIVAYARSGSASPRVAEALAEVMRRRQALAALERERAARDREVAQIAEEQTRIRGNMDRLDRAGDLYARYVRKFDEQETRIERLREEMAEFEKQVAAARSDLERFIAALDLD
jgi:hypothetical protein